MLARGKKSRASLDVGSSVSERRRQRSMAAVGESELLRESMAVNVARLDRASGQQPETCDVEP